MTGDQPGGGSGESLQSRLRTWAAEDLAEIRRTYMPFGKYGPEHFPPHGRRIYDLPLEYLLWFRQKGFPKGRFGELLRIVCQMKADGCDEVFDHFRQRR
jgi:uncharacterized protein (DUF3820 family)